MVVMTYGEGEGRGRAFPGRQGKSVVGTAVEVGCPGHMLTEGGG